MIGKRRDGKHPELRGRVLAGVYLLLVVLIVTAFLGFAYRTPGSVDKGIAILSRALVYNRGFGDIDRAAAEIDQGRFDQAEILLTRFLERHPEVQRSQLRTHPWVVCHELLAHAQQEQGKVGRALATLENLTETVPLNYRAWYLRGKVEKAAGDLGSSAASLDRSFRLSLINTEVIEEYLGVLLELGDFPTVLWVDDQFHRAQFRAAPTATVHLGQRRPDWQASLLARAGIPVEHGRSFRTFTVRDLDRGSSQVLRFPPDILVDWPSWASKATVQVRFDHIFDGLRLEGVLFQVDESGSEWIEERLDPQSIRELHQPYSSAEHTFEFDLGRDPAQIRGLAIRYSCPPLELSPQAQAIIAKASANQEAFEVIQ